MELSTILVKISGAGLLLWTLYSIYRHVQEKRSAMKSVRKSEETQSVSEQILNNILLYLWLAFMIVFSGGMILNN
jgi:threonine/homoserine/homoserine lactone efflux protein